MNGPKVLLMPLGMGGEVQERIYGALCVAKRFEAQLRVLHISVSPRSIIPEEVFLMSREALGRLYAAFDQHVGLDTRRVKKLFLEVCARASVPVVDGMNVRGPSASWTELQGLRSGLVARYGKAADWVVMAVPPERCPTGTYEAAVLETGRPLLVIPRTMARFSPDTVLVAWNGTTEASRSLAHSLPILQQARRVVVASIDSGEALHPSANVICKYLGAHGIAAEAAIVPPGTRSAGHVLEEKVAGDEVDLVVMGAYDRKRLGGTKFGSVTNHMFAHAEVPLFLSR